MITTVDVAKQDIEEAISKALAEYRSEHNKEPKHLVMGRIAYEEFRTMHRLGNPGADTPKTVEGLNIVVIEDPPDALAIGSLPD